jgi:hypothetical protein
MRKSLILILLFILGSGARANLATPQAYISEIFVDSTGNWTIEMGFYEWDAAEIDSIMLETSSGSSIITFFTTIPGGGHFDSLSVITNANLAIPVSVNPDGDFVKLISYAWGDDPFDYIAFGNYPGSQIDCIQGGESVIFLCYTQSEGPAHGFCMDLSPTIGEVNDTIGALETFAGKVYDLLGNPFTDGFFPLPGVTNTVIFIQPDGSFSERIFSRRFTFETIIIRFPPWPWTVKTYTVEPVDFCLRPDSSYYQDIVTTSLVIGFDDKVKADENMVTIAPNPFSDLVVFYFNLKNEFLSDDLKLSIYDLNGREIHHISFTGDLKRYEWAPAGKVSSGTYIYRLEKDNQLIKTGKFVRL